MITKHGATLRNVKFIATHKNKPAEEFLQQVIKDSTEKEKIIRKSHNRSGKEVGISDSLYIEV